jgi:hypothetical protein
MPISMSIFLGWAHVVVGRTWQQSTLCQSKKSPHSQKATIVANETKAHPNNAPSARQKCQPESRAEFFQHEVARQLSRNIEGEENSEAIGILSVRHADVFLESQNLGIANVRAIQERAEEQKCEDWQDSV